MARKPAPSQSGSKSRHSPSAAAVGRVAKLASSGAPPTRMVTAIEAVVGLWRDEEVPQDDMRERLEQLQSDLDGGVVAVENAEGQAETDGQRRAMQAQRDALVAAREAVTRVIETLGD